ncbi:MAG: hypothetical protein ACE5FI_17595 [Anaerolineales bacterium]
MPSSYHRRSRKQFRWEAQALAANTDVAGLRVSVFRRFVLAVLPPPRALSGRTRRDGARLTGASGVSYDVFVVIGGGRASIPTDFVPPTVGAIETRIGG